LVAGAFFFFSTRPAVVALARGLEIFALGFAGVDFLVAVVVLVVVGSGVGLMSLRGALLPVACRVETMVVWRLCMSLNGGFEMGSRGWIVVGY